MGSTVEILDARGVLGLPHGDYDLLPYQLFVNSLGGFRRYFAAHTTRDSTLVDSLAGTATIRGTAYGRLDSLDLSGKVEGTGLLVGKTRGRIVGGQFAIRNVIANPSGTASVRID